MRFITDEVFSLKEDLKRNGKEEEKKVAPMKGGIQKMAMSFTLLSP
jgi:hypothetical protein